MAPVKATLVGDLERATAPGAFEYVYSRGGEQNPVGLIYICPCGCGASGRLKFGGPNWNWDGNRDKPTVTPSVLLITGRGDHWHGWLMAGEWRSV